MGDLRYRQMTVMELIQSHFSRYETDPSEKVLKDHVDWAMGLNQKAVEYALDPRNHPHISGSVPRPKLPTLMRLAFEGTRQEPKVHPTDRYYRPIDDVIDECLYCVNGEVNDLVWRDKWVTKAIGRCKHCSGGDTECHPGIIAVAQRWQMHCTYVIFKLLLMPLFIVDWDSKRSVKSRKAGRQEVVKEFLEGLVEKPMLAPLPTSNLVESLPEHLKGLDEHKGTDAEQVPF